MPDHAHDRIGGYPGSGDRDRVGPPAPVLSASARCPLCAGRDVNDYRDCCGDCQAEVGEAMADDSLAQLEQRIDAVLADLEHVRDRHGTTHHDACWDEHIGCLAARVTRTLRGESDG